MGLIFPKAAPGVQGSGRSDDPGISADGRWVVFQSEASNLVKGDTKGVSDIFVHDRQTGTTERVSVASDGTQGDGESFSPTISADGHWVAFWSFASNLAAGDTEKCGEGDNTYNCADVFVHDRQMGTTERIVAGGRRGLGGDSDRLGISADGRWVAFYSWASNLVAGDTNGRSDVFVHGRQTGITELVSVAGDGTLGNGNGVEPAISVDGRWVAFVSWASNLVAGDTNAQPGVFVYDRQTGETRLVSVASDGTQADEISGAPGVSADGRLVVFWSLASNLVADNGNGFMDVFVHDRRTGRTERVP